MNQLSLEIQLLILCQVPLATFPALYKVFPMRVVDAALCIKLREGKKTRMPLLDLVSSNLHEVSGPCIVSGKNESAMALFFETLDSDHRVVWLMPDFSPSRNLFAVKDAYVSHGKLLLRSHTLSNSNSTPTKQLLSLWDIRKRFPPSRAGSFSGASETTTWCQRRQSMTVNCAGCIVDTWLLPCTAAEQTKDSSDTIDPDILDLPCVSDGKLPRPELPAHYVRRIPSHALQESHDTLPYNVIPPCGYCLVERVGISVPALLDLVSQ